MSDRCQYEFSDAEIAAAAASGRLLSLEIEFNRQCNYRCPYCYAAASGEATPSYDPRVIDRAVSEAAALGARKIVILGGEPFLFKELQEKIRMIRGLGLGAEIHTNGSIMDAALASFLQEQDCRVVVKLNSRNPAVQERLTGIGNSLENSLRTLQLLQAAGFAPDRLGASTIISADNIDEVADLWKYLRRQKIEPYFEILTPQGRLLDHKELEVDILRLRQVFAEIEEFDRSLGHHWQAQPPLVGAKCLRHLYSALVNARGDVFPCVGVDIAIGNILARPLARILHESTIIRDLKNHLEMIKGPCRSCDKAATCYGCRGAAYQLTGDYLASDPLCWRNAGKQQEIQALPVAAAPYMPHRPPMAMIEKIVQGGVPHIVSAVIHPDNLFLQGNGILDRVAVPELVAQAGAVMDSFHYDGRVRPGFIALGHAIRFSRDMLCGDEIFIAFTDENLLENWFLLNFSMTNQRGELCAQGEVNVCVV